MRTRALLVAALLLSACGDLGADLPECGFNPQRIPLSVIMEAQAVPSARWGPCLRDLELGWQYEDLQVESGMARFWLDSDRMGDRFLEVTLTATCDVSGLVVSRTRSELIDVYIDEIVVPAPVQVVVLPVAPRHKGYAIEVMAALRASGIGGRAVTVEMDTAEGNPSMRIQEALKRFRFVLVIDDPQQAARQVELRAEDETESGLQLGEAIDEIAADLSDVRYEAVWYHTFQGGCVTWRFDARGLEAQDVAEAATEAVGFYPLRQLREGALEQGINYGG